MLEGIQDSLDEARYEQAILDSRLCPIEALPAPEPEVLNEYAQDITPNLTPQKVCGDGVGFYLFIKFLKESDETVILGGFLRDLAYLQYNHESQDKFINTVLLREIVRRYLDEDLIGDFSLCPSPKHILRGSSKKAIVFKPAELPPENPDKVTYSVEDAVAGASEISLRFCGVGEKTSTIDDEMDEEEDRDLTHVWKLHYNGDLSSITVEDLLVIGSKAFDSIAAALFDSFLHSIFYAKFVLYHYLAHHLSAHEHDFQSLRLIGRGAFGKVYAAKHRHTGKLYAIKTMSKSRINLHKCQQMCLNEREYLQCIHSPYVLSLKYAYSTLTDISLVFELMTGGSIDYHIKRKPFNPSDAVYYAARCVLGIEALHAQNIVFRDLKPQNILLDATGRSKLVDLGLAERIVDPAGLTKVCGTRGYWAPEMISTDLEGKKRGYSFMVDWFSLGCVVYEMLQGINPFTTTEAMEFEDQVHLIEEHPMSAHHHSHWNKRSEKQKLVDKAIMHMVVDVSEVQDIQARDFIDKLLIKNPDRRLGAKGIEEIKSHPWFKEIVWKTLDWVEPPFKPLKENSNVCLVSEIGDFDDEEEVKEVHIDEKDQQVYKNWNYYSAGNMTSDLLEYLQYVDINGEFKFKKQKSFCCVVQ